MNIELAHLWTDAQIARQISLRTDLIRGLMHNYHLRQCQHTVAVCHLAESDGRDPVYHSALSNRIAMLSSVMSNDLERADMWEREIKDLICVQQERQEDYGEVTDEETPDEEAAEEEVSNEKGTDEEAENADKDKVGGESNKEI